MKPHRPLGASDPAFEIWVHRVTGKGYGAQSCPLATPVVSYAYDSGANATGKLSSLTDQAGTASYSYDIMGRLATETRTLTGANNAVISKNLSYSYNLNGSLKSLTYPSGNIVTYTPDSAGRMLSAIDTGNGINYVTSATYGPDGGLTGFISGNSAPFAGITSAFSYNKRLQPVNMSANAPSQTVFSIGYDFHLGNGTTGADNGNVFGITNYKDQNRSQTFTYDALNRLASAQNAGTNCAATVIGGKSEYWGNSYGYDAWGNLLNKSITKCSAEHFSVAALANNQLSGYGYDAAGNMTSDPTDGIPLITYDQENRLTGASGYTYTYDADGNRVRKSNGSTGTLYWYMTPGVVAESDLAGTLKSEYIFFDGERVARKDFPGNAVAYYFSDHLKTASVVTDSLGNIKSESDFYPWGGELQFVSNDSNHYKFIGKERDPESGLDQMGARYYSSAMARFTSPDPLFIAVHRLPDPQMWNLYHYGRNNPLKFTDSTGLDVKLDCSQVSSGQCGQTVDQLNSRKDAQFSVTRDDKTGLLKVDGKVDASKLSKGEGALYNAITDTDHHATLQVVNQSDMVTFGRFDGNGHNTIDASDMKLLNNASPQAAGETIAHEALESYGSSFGNGNDFSLWHGYANQFFGQVTNGSENYTLAAHGSPYYTQDWNFHRIGADLDVKTVITPQPANSVPRAYTPGTIVDVQPANQQNH